MEPVARPMPMFPLSIVAYPGSLVPLQLFEPRYLALFRDVMAGDRRFGIVLITRGRETGGGDLRADVGTAVEVVRSAEVADGRVAVVGAGRERLRVHEWLPDDPYPRAMVSSLPEPAAVPGADQRLADALAIVGRILTLRGRLGIDVPSSDHLASSLATDPARAAFELAALAGLGPHDGQRVLAAPTVDGRFDALLEGLEGARAVLEFEVSS